MSQKDSPSYHRNIGPITDIFRKLFSEDSTHVLEVGSGSGQHITSLSKHFPRKQFYPTELQTDDLAGIDAWAKELQCSNVAKAQHLDVSEPIWSLEPSRGYDILFCLNVIHITPWLITERLFQGASSVLKKGGRLYLYGPFKVNGEHTSSSNAEFEEWLKAKDVLFGVRDIEDVSNTAQKRGFSLTGKHEMPANNFILEFSFD